MPVLLRLQQRILRKCSIHLIAQVVDCGEELFLQLQFRIFNLGRYCSSESCLFLLLLALLLHWTEDIRHLKPFEGLSVVIGASMMRAVDRRFRRLLSFGLLGGCALALPKEVVEVTMGEGQLGLLPAMHRGTGPGAAVPRYGKAQGVDASRRLPLWLSGSGA